MKQHKNKIIAGAVILVVLAFVYWWGGDAPGLRGWNPHTVENTGIEGNGHENSAVEIPSSKGSPSAEPSGTSRNPAAAASAALPAETEQAPGDSGASRELVPREDKPQNVNQIPMTADTKESLDGEMDPDDSSYVENGDKDYSEKSGMDIDDTTGKDQYETDPVPAGRPVPIEPEDAVISDKEQTCTLSVRCDTILKHMAWLDPEKAELVPGDGVILAEQTVSFYEGESVFNLLVREMKRNKIHMEFENTPIYHSAYIEGISNLYEFDCGELSGWMYKVNDWFPNYGCSRYQLQPGDKVEWVYTCDLGADVGGYYSTRNGK